MTWTKLHELLAARPTPFTNAAVIKNARERPESIVSVDDRGYSPLHIAVTSNDTPPLEAIRALVNVFPNAVMAKVSLLYLYELLVNFLYIQ
jgi:ankyrin repeat protein